MSAGGRQVTTDQVVATGVDKMPDPDPDRRDPGRDRRDSEQGLPPDKGRDRHPDHRDPDRDRRDSEQGLPVVDVVVRSCSVVSWGSGSGVDPLHTCLSRRSRN